MPYRDDTGSRWERRRVHVTRRATLAGLAATVLTPRFDAVGSGGGVPLRIGVLDGLGFDANGLSQATLARWRRPAVPVAVAAWGSLADHAAGTGEGIIDGAVLPAEGTETALPIPPGLRATLLLRTAQPRRLGVALRHPGTEVALRGLVANGSLLTLLVMPPAMLVGNLQAGVVDAALLLGVEGGVADGVTVVPLGHDVAKSLLPPLALRLRPDLSDQGAPSA